MITNTAPTTLAPLQAMVSNGISRLPKRYLRTSPISECTRSEIIEILERSGKQESDFTQFVSKCVVAVTVMTSIAASAVFGLQVNELVDTQIRFTLGEMVLVIAGR